MSSYVSPLSYENQIPGLSAGIYSKLHRVYTSGHRMACEIESMPNRGHPTAFVSEERPVRCREKGQKEAADKRGSTGRNNQRSAAANVPEEERHVV
jgi:hypothetical protein